MINTYTQGHEEASVVGGSAWEFGDSVSYLLADAFGYMLDLDSRSGLSRGPDGLVVGFRRFGIAR